ncbi:recombinase family protein [Lawsonibacter asaccharolyticus]
MRYAYIRVSTKEQHLDRQIEAIKEYRPDEVFADKLSGKNFDRPEYHRLKSMIRRGDEIIVKELDRLGRNKDAVKEELKWFKDNGVIVRVLDIPTTMIELPGQEWIAEMVNNILIEVIAAVAEQERKKIRQRQKEGIACARERGVKFGRPEKDVECVLLEGETVRAACRRLGVSKTYWYEQKKKTGLPSTKSTSQSTSQTPKDGADTEIVSCAS